MTHGADDGGTPVSVRPFRNRSASCGGPTRSVGAFSDPARTGRTSRGVTMITSSVSSCWKPFERKSVPMIGKEPSSGTWLIVLWKSFLIRPASAKLSPSRISTTVFARRV